MLNSHSHFKKQMTVKKEQDKDIIEDLFKSGAHFGYSRSRRHPSARGFIFGEKNKIEIIDLEKTVEYLNSAIEYVEELGAKGAQILFVGGKAESQKHVKEVAESISMPYVSGRWIGGTLTNFDEIKSRVEKLEKLRTQKEKGELGKYTKKERLLFDKEIERLEGLYAGLLPMTKKPDALFIVDTNRESIAIREARVSGIPVISISGTDCDFEIIDYPIPANDSNGNSISLVVKKIAEAYKKGQENGSKKNTASVKEDSK